MFLAGWISQSKRPEFNCLSCYTAKRKGKAREHTDYLQIKMKYFDALQHRPFTMAVV